MERIEFDKDMKSTWGAMQAKLSKLLIHFLELGRSFYIEIGFIRQSKTYEQLKGIYRIVKLYAIRMSDKQGSIITEATAKELLKYKFDIVRLANYDEAFREAMKIKREKELLGSKMTLKELNFLTEKLQRTYEVPKSFADMSKEEATNLIKRIEDEWVVGFGWSEMQLLPEELRKINDYFKE